MNCKHSVTSLVNPAHAELGRVIRRAELKALYERLIVERALYPAGSYFHRVIQTQIDTVMDQLDDPQVSKAGG